MKSEKSYIQNQTKECENKKQKIRKEECKKRKLSLILSFDDN